MSRTWTTVATIVLLGAIGSTRAASAALAPTVNHHLDAIAAYAGTWDARLTYVKTPYSSARTEHVRIENDCWHSGDIAACHQFVGGASAALLVYTYDTKSDAFFVHVVPSEGTAGSAPGTLIIRGNVWTFPWRQDDHGKTVSFRVVNIFRDARTIEFHQSYSLDRIHWIDTASGIEHRIG